jgi:hypothetical protein
MTSNKGRKKEREREREKRRRRRQTRKTPDNKLSCSLKSNQEPLKVVTERTVS